LDALAAVVGWKHCDDGQVGTKPLGIGKK